MQYSRDHNSEIVFHPPAPCRDQCASILSVRQINFRKGKCSPQTLWGVYILYVHSSLNCEAGSNIFFQYLSMEDKIFPDSCDKANTAKPRVAENDFFFLLDRRLLTQILELWKIG